MCCQAMLYNWGVARIFQGGGGGGGGHHTVTHPGYLHNPLQMFGPENRVCNHPTLGKIYGMLFFQICTFLPPEACILFT